MGWVSLLNTGIGIAQSGRVLLFDADPFAVTQARLLGAIPAADWSSSPSGLPASLTVLTEHFVPGVGLGSAVRVSLSPLPAGARFALVNQLDSDLSVFSVSSLPTSTLDRDGNGLSDAWERSYFGSTGVDPNGDPDSDGFSNREEFQAGTSPIDASSQPEIRGIVARWKGDGDPLDSQGAHPGTWVGEAEYGTGRSGQAFHFRPGHYVRVPDHPLLRPDPALTVAGWVRVDRFGENGMPVLSRPSQHPGIPAFELELGARGPRLRLANAVASRSDGPDLELAPGVWHHLAATYDGSEVRLYVGGQLVFTETLGGVGIGALDMPAGAGLFLGHDGHTRSFEGSIQEVVFAGRSLSMREVRALALRADTAWRAVFERVSPRLGSDEVARLRFPLRPGSDDAAVESAVSLGGEWVEVEAVRERDERGTYLEVSVSRTLGARFFRLRR
ncbi:MAG: LamG domain-containing protein [Verrucomicrobiales bacterium]|nr:LamG domain-containing protein [Verrucomicrobiales bacterium]